MSSTAKGAVRWAIAGAGLFAKEAHLPALVALGDKVELGAIYSRSLASAQELGALAKEQLGQDVPLYCDADANANLDAMLARPDITAVAVVLPISMQPDVILRSLAAGKHVLSEKPVAKDVASGIELIKEYEAKYKHKGLIWRVAENFEVEPAHQVAKKAILDGKIGKLSMFNLSSIGALDESSKWYKTPWRTVPDYQGGFLLDGGVHSAAVLRAILPDPIATLSGFATLTKKYLAPQDTIQSIVETTGGATGIFELSFAAPYSSRATSSTTFTGSSGWISIGQEKVDGKSVARVTVRSVKEKGKDKDGNVEYEEVVEVHDEAWGIGVKVEFAAFVDLLNGDDRGFGHPRGALLDVALIQAGLTSNGKPVSFKELVPDF